MRISDRCYGFCLSLVLALCATAAPDARSSAAEASIRDLVAQYVAARDSMDPVKLAGLFTAEADQLVSTGDWRRGRPDLVNGTLSSSKKESGHRTVTVETVRLISPEVAIVDGRYDVTGPGAAIRHMWTTFVCKYEQGAWKIAAIRNMLPAPSH